MATNIHLASAGLTRLAAAVCGDQEPWHYRTHSDLLLLLSPFRHLVKDAVTTSRGKLVASYLSALNGSEAMKKIIEEIIDPRHFSLDQETRVEDHALAVIEINESLKYDGYTIEQRAGRWVVVKSQDNAINPPQITTSIPPLEAGFIDECIYKCREAILNEDYSGAIRGSRSMCEQVLQAIANDLEVALEDSDKLTTITKKVTTALGMREETLGDEFKQLTQSLSSVVQAIGNIRNKMSDAHRQSMPALKHYAELCVDSSFAFSKFILAVHHRRKGSSQVKDVNHVEAQRAYNTVVS